MEGVSSVRIVGKPYRIFSTEYAVHYTLAPIWMECVDRATVRGRTISQPRWGKTKAAGPSGGRKGRIALRMRGLCIGQGVPMPPMIT
jgi:hypothetical protein